MNERIKELLEQAGVKYVIMPKDTVYEKFAELIINECITAVKNTPKHCAYTTFQESIVDCTVDMSVQSIKQHFNLNNDSK